MNLEISFLYIGIYSTFSLLNIVMFIGRKEKLFLYICILSLVMAVLTLVQSISFTKSSIYMLDIFYIAAICILMTGIGRYILFCPPEELFPLYGPCSIVVIAGVVNMIAFHQLRGSKIFLFILFFYSIWYLMFSSYIAFRKQLYYRKGTNRLIISLQFLLSGLVIIIALSLFNVHFSHVVTGIPFIFFISVITLTLIMEINKEHFDLLELKKDFELRIQERTEQLHREKLTLEVESQQKIDFFIKLFHEIKTPITLIVNYLEKYIKRKGIDTETEYMRNYLREINTDFVNLLDYENSLRKEIDNSHICVSNLSSILTSQMVLLRDYGTNKRLSFRQHIENGLCVRADGHCLKRIMNNLIENAIKYTKVGGTITVDLFSEGSVITFKLADTGIGIPKDKLDKIFLPYYQVSHKKSEDQGVGMGLNIVKILVDSIDKASISIDSAVNEGTAVSLQFERAEGINEFDEEGPGIERIPQSLNKIKMPKEPSVQKNHNTIFFIDDNIELISLVQSELAERYNFFYATNGNEALNKLETIPVPDVIISDVMMDGMDGCELYHTISNNYNYNDIPFIFLSALSDRDMQYKSIQCGVIDYITKPFYVDLLKAKIESHIIIRDKYKAKIRQRIIKAVDEGVQDRVMNSNLIGMLCAQYGLTDRELQIVNHLILSKSTNQEIACRMFISIKTLEKHLTSIYKKVKVQNKIELIQMFVN